MSVQCKKCGGKRFRTISLLRKHQWAAHIESFDNLRVAASTKGLTVRELKLQVPEVKLLESPQSGELTAQELLTKLKEQSTFLENVCSLIGGMIAQHTQAQAGVFKK